MSSRARRHVDPGRRKSHLRGRLMAMRHRYLRNGRDAEKPVLERVTQPAGVASILGYSACGRKLCGSL